MVCTRPKRIYTHATGETGMLVPCNRCIACRIQKSNEWKIRLLLESFDHDDSTFLTLTYSDEHCPLDFGLRKKDYQDFMKRLRYYLGDKKIKHYSVGEYGGDTSRPHFHSIIFGWYDSDFYLHHKEGSKSYFSSLVVDKAWPYGMNVIGTVTSQSIDYVCGYIRKKLYGQKAISEYGNREPPFQLFSKYLGLNYVIRNKEKIIKDQGIKLKGVNHGISKYFFNKICDSDELREFIKLKTQLTNYSELLDYAERRGIEGAQLYKEVLEDRLQRERDNISRERLFNQRRKV